MKRKLNKDWSKQNKNLNSEKKHTLYSLFKENKIINAFYPFMFLYRRQAALLRL